MTITILFSEAEQQHKLAESNKQLTEGIINNLQHNIYIYLDILYIVAYGSKS